MFYINLLFILDNIYMLFMLSSFLLFFVFYSISNKYNYPLYNNIIVFFIIIFFVNLFIILLCVPHIEYSNYFITLNNTNIMIKKFTLVSFFFFFLISFFFLKKEKLNSFEIYFFFLVCFFSFGLLITVNDFLLFYLVLELQSMCFYLLSAIRKKNIYSVEAGFKYFILGSFSSAILLFGISMLYGICGFTNFIDIYVFFQGYNIWILTSYIANYTYGNIFFIFSFSLIFFSFFFKTYVAPLHFWIVDIYNGISILMVAFFSIFPSFILYYLLIKIILIFNMNVYWSFFFLFFSILSMLIGSIGAVIQKKLKKFFAYSTIVNNGNLLLFIFLLKKKGIFILYYLIFFYFIYIITISFIFFFLISIMKKKKQYYSLDSISELAGIFHIYPTLSFFFIFFIFSLAGVPPTPGFLAKMYLFLCLSFIENNIFILLFFILITLLSCYYYLRLIKVVYFNKLSYWPFFFRIKTINVYILNFYFLIFLSLILFPGFFQSYIYTNVLFL